MNAPEKTIECQDWGLVSYRDALERQEKLRAERISGKIRNQFILCEHPPVFTTGRRECEEDFVSEAHAIANDGIEIVRTNRGGRVTYHGPGQVVGYFIVELESVGMGIKNFVHAIEETLILTLSDFGIRSHRDEIHPGIWIGRKKIAAIGLNVSRGVTTHGFALNVNCDLKPYRHIIACGIKDRGVTTMAMQISKDLRCADVKLCITQRIMKSNFKFAV